MNQYETGDITTRNETKTAQYNLCLLIGPKNSSVISKS